MKQRRTRIEDAQELAQELAGLFDELALEEEDKLAKSMLKSMNSQALSMVKRCEALAQLRDFKGYKFAVIDPKTGELRKASTEEAKRLIMDMPPVQAGDALRILNQYYQEVDNGRTPDTSNWDWLKGESK